MQGAVSIPCTDSTDLTRVLEYGNSRRATGQTAMNERSSRSHCVFQVSIESIHHEENNEPRTTDPDEIKTVGKLNLVDLAGSERQSKAQTSGETFREAAKINLGLLTLGNVISSLAERLRQPQT